MTEQTAEDKFHNAITHEAEILLDSYQSRVENRITAEEFERNVRNFPSGIVSLFKQAGYKSPAEIVLMFSDLEETNRFLSEQLSHARDGYVQLDADPTLPSVVTSYNDTDYNRGFTDGSNYERANLLKLGLRKIKQE